MEIEEGIEKMAEINCAENIIEIKDKDNRIHYLLMYPSEDYSTIK